MRNTSRFFIQFIHLAGAFWHSENKSTIRSLTLALVALTVLQIAVAVIINHWSANLFNALEQRSMPGLFTQAGLFVLIFIANIGITSTHLKIKRRLQLDWRGWLTDKLIGQWMRDGRHYLVTHIAGGQHDNPDSRIAEDIRIATESAIDLLHSFFYSFLLLISFTQILWELSGTVTLDMGILSIPIYGHLFWLALIYASSATILGWWIGRPLTSATNNRQTVEANFRFALVKARENSQAIALIHGERHEKPHFHRIFQGIVEAWNQQTSAWAQIIMFSSGYSVLSMAFPVIVSSPRYILGSIGLGTLMQSAQAFQQLAAALSWPVDNMGKVAEWRASVERVLGLYRSLEQLEHEINRQGPHRIKLEKNEGAVLRFKKLCICRLDGVICITQIDEDIYAGERVLIDSSSLNGNKLFKAIAGLWPWGQGTIELPDDEPLFFMPPRPYLPTDTLRASVCYPTESSSFSQSDLEFAFQQAGIKELLDHLDSVNDWATVLESEQQQRLGVVRLFLQKPKWVMANRPLDALNPKAELAMMELIHKTLPESSILTISNQPAIQALYSRHLTVC